MQRSRRALLKRRAALENSIYGKLLMYKVSLSLVLVSWGLVFLICSLISHGKSHRDMLLGVWIDKSAWHEEIHSQVPDSKIPLNLNVTVSTLIHNLRDDPVSNTEISTIKRNEHTLSAAGQVNVSQQISDLGARALEEPPAKSAKLSRAAPLGLDEFRSKAITSKGKPVTGRVGSLIHRVEPGGKDYNYASATKGAKVLASNKEAKGSWNILDKDKNKYLRNPCSAEEKFVVVELSEETLVDTVEIGNFEHYSSNLKDFELLTSLVYPTDTWVKAGKFAAANVKHEQRFALQEPQWARYLRLNLLSHYGSEFYCTLSVLEVYGIDVVERMLEDLISVQDARTGPEKPSAERPLSSGPNCGDAIYPALHREVNSDTGKEDVRAKCYTWNVNGIDPGGDSRPGHVGRVPGDAVLKILMQKVQQLDLTLSILEQYLEEVNDRYGDILEDFDDEIADTELLLGHIRVEMKNLHNSSNELTKDIMELVSWKLLVSLHLENFVKNNAVLRSEVEKIHGNQVDMEERSLLTYSVMGHMKMSKRYTEEKSGFPSPERCDSEYNKNWKTSSPASAPTSLSLPAATLNALTLAHRRSPTLKEQRKRGRGSRIPSLRCKGEKEKDEGRGCAAIAGASPPPCRLSSRWPDAVSPPQEVRRREAYQAKKRICRSAEALTRRPDPFE